MSPSVTHDDGRLGGETTVVIPVCAVNTSTEEVRELTTKMTTVSHLAM